jgi:hypothetical protein
MRNEQVQVIILPLQNGKTSEKPEADIEPSLYAPDDTVAERIRKFQEKHSHESFIEHLKQKQAEGVKCNFDVRKVIDGTETEEEIQERYRILKRAWANDVAGRVNRNEL